MYPDPEPKATSATPIDSTRTAPNGNAENRRRGSTVSGVMAGILAIVCGATAAFSALPLANAGDDASGNALTLAAVANPSIAGRWSGTPYAIRNDASRCNGEDCKLVLDIVACDGGWCGIEVSGKEETCGATAMQLKTHSDPKRQNAFEGRLTLAKGTSEYVIDAHLEPAEDGRPAMLEIVGDTGPEFRWFRRSFPFHTAMTHIGDALCRISDKPVS